MMRTMIVLVFLFVFNPIIVFEVQAIEKVEIKKWVFGFDINFQTFARKHEGESFVASGIPIESGGFYGPVPWYILKVKCPNLGLELSQCVLRADIIARLERSVVKGEISSVQYLRYAYPREPFLMNPNDDENGKSYHAWAGELGFVVRNDSPIQSIGDIGDFENLVIGVGNQINYGLSQTQQDKLTFNKISGEGWNTRALEMLSKNKTKGRLDAVLYPSKTMMDSSRSAVKEEWRGKVISIPSNVLPGTRFYYVISKNAMDLSLSDLKGSPYHQRGIRLYSIFKKKQSPEQNDNFPTPLAIEMNKRMQQIHEPGEEQTFLVGKGGENRFLNKEKGEHYSPEEIIKLYEQWELLLYKDAASGMLRLRL